MQRSWFETSVLLSCACCVCDAVGRGKDENHSGKVNKKVQFMQTKKKKKSQGNRERNGVETPQLKLVNTIDEQKVDRIKVDNKIPPTNDLSAARPACDSDLEYVLATPKKSQPPRYVYQSRDNGWTDDKRSRLFSNPRHQQ